MADLPTGTVTFLFSDIEGSTRLLQRLGADYARVLGEHQAFLRRAWSDQGGVEVDTQGDSFFVAFASAPAAVAAAAQATRALAEHVWPDDAEVRVRIGLHTGTPQLVGVHYVGLDVHRAARIAAAGHGGQVLLSDATEALVRDALPEGAALRDLGAHRLKDLQHAERLYQLVLPGLPTDFPPLKSLDARPHNLPVQPTPLLGREEAVATVCVLLRRDDVRLVTLTGPGGIGKTRLAIQVAAELLDDFADGVWLVRLSRLTDPALVLPTIVQTLGLREQGGAPIAETLREYLRPRHVLLVLDNFEQVMGAAPEVGGLLESCPGLAVLATSRIPLRLRGEKSYPVAPLPLPDPGRPSTPERLSQYAAVALFVERARDARPDFAVTAANAPAIAEICARLDGLPLAIELAAARVRLLPPEAMLARLVPPPGVLGRLAGRLRLLTGGARDAEERQRTMQATLAWSEDLLGPRERTLFRRLAVFAGGWTLEAAEAVCAAPEGAEPLGMDVLDGLGTLVEQSLVQQREEDDEPRFGMLHVIREYGLERWDPGEGGAALRRAHAAYFLALAERAEPELRGANQTAWLRRLEREHDNLRAALGWARERGEAETGLRLAVALYAFWRAGGHPSEAEQWLDAMVALGEAPATAARATGGGGTTGALAFLRARAQADVGLVAFGRANSLEGMRRAEALLRRGLDAAREVGDLPSAVSVLSDLGALARLQGDAQGAEERFDEALALAHQSGDDDMLLEVLGDFGNLFSLLVQGEDARAAALADKALELARRLGRPEVEVSVMRVPAWAAFQRDDLASAQALAADGLRLARARRLVALQPAYIMLLAWVAVLAGRNERAARLMGAGMTLQERLNSVPSPRERATLFAPVQPARAALGEEAWEATYAAGAALSLEEAVAEALGEGTGRDDG